MLGGGALTASAFLAAAAGASASVNTPAFTAPAGGGVVTELALASTGYTKCVNDYGQDHAIGAKVALYTCNSADPGSQWVTFPDGTFRPYSDTSLVMAVNPVTNKIVLEPAGIGSPSAAAVWYIRDDGTLVSNLSNEGVNNKVLNDPGYNAANGTQLISWNQPVATGNAHWWVTKARYASSTLSNRPDSGNGGSNWANDRITRGSMVLYMGGPSGSNGYQASVYDVGSFHALAGVLTPNQVTYAGDKMWDSTGGTLAGFANYQFVSSSFVTRFPAASYSGSTPTTGDWPKLFFPAGAVSSTGMYGSGPVDWHWGYMQTSNDSCGVMESWLDAGWNNGGGTSSAGNIFGGAPATATPGYATCAQVDAAARPSLYGD